MWVPRCTLPPDIPHVSIGSNWAVEESMKTVFTLLICLGLIMIAGRPAQASNVEDYMELGDLKNEDLVYSNEDSRWELFKEFDSKRFILNESETAIAALE
jgi:hypothetical protein